MSALALVALAAAEVPLDAEHVRPGYIAMGIVGLLGVALVLLMFSFVKHLKRVDFPEDPPVGR